MSIGISVRGFKNLVFEKLEILYKKLKRKNTMKVNQNTKFTSNTMVGSGGILYALANKITKTDEDGRVSYEADAIKIQNVSDAQMAIKKFNLENIITETKSFYGDGESRADLLTVLILKLADSIDDTEVVPTEWKTKSGVITMTFGDIKTAVHESLKAKESIVFGS